MESKVKPRLKAPPSEKLIRNASRPRLEREIGHFRQFMKVDMAHTVMLVEQNILARKDGARILRTLREIDHLGPDRFPIDADRGSFLFQVENYLFDKIGEDTGGRMHTGRSRIDQGAAVRRLFKRDRLLNVIGGLLELQRVLLKIAARHVHTVMPGYTCMQHAQPWVFGHVMLSYFDRFQEDFERLTEAYARVNRNPLGTVGLSGTAWPLSRERTTTLLGFGGLVENSKLGREALYAAEAIAMLSFVTADLNDLATDLHVWSTHEFGFVESADEYCGTSSIFPQKKNPNALDAIKQVTGGSVVWLSSALATFRSEGTGDVVVRELPLIDSAFQDTENMLDLMAGVVDTLIVHRGRMRETVSANWSTASNLADYIVRERGLSYRQTHHIVANFVRTALAEKVDPAAVTAAMVDKAAVATLGKPLGLDTRGVRDAVDPQSFVKTRVTRGSVSLAEVRRMIGASRGTLKAERKWLTAKRRSIKGAYERLDRAMDRITKTK